MVRYNLEELNRQFGVDFMYEWRNLNEVIGDTGGSVDEFYDSFEYLLKHIVGLETEDLFPKLDELKEYPEEFTKVVSEWLDKTNFDPIYMSVELDTTKADKWLDEFITKYNNGEITLNNQPVFPTPSSYAPQLPVGKDGKIDISISLDVENANVGSVKANPSTVLRGDSFWGNVKVDPVIDNGKSSSWR